MRKGGRNQMKKGERWNTHVFHRNKEIEKQQLWPNHERKRDSVSGGCFS